MKKYIILGICMLTLVGAYAQHDKDKWHSFSNVPDLLYYLKLNGYDGPVANEGAYGIEFKDQ